MISREAYSLDHVCLTGGYQGWIFPEIPLKEAKKLLDPPKGFNTTGMPLFSYATLKFDWKPIATVLGFILFYKIL
jgi:hypothetical protein